MKFSDKGTKSTCYFSVATPLLEKMEIIDTLDADERETLLKLLIDMAAFKKKLKDNLSSLIAS